MTGKVENLSVLLVEDDEDDFVLTSDLLAGAGGTRFELCWARTVAEGLRRLAETEPDVVLLDYRVGEENGLDFLGRLPARGKVPPVILLTGQDDPATDIAAMRAGAADYLVKGEITPLLLERSIRYAVERARADADLRLRDRAIAAVSEGILMTNPHRPDNPIVFANSGFERLTGYAADEVVGRNCRFLQGPGTDPAAVAEIGAAVAAGRGCVVELLNYRRDGTPFWNRLSITPVRNAAGELMHFVGIQQDVTGRKRMEEALLWSERRFRSLVENAPDTVAVLDEKGVFRYFSPALPRILAHDPAELQGTYALDLIHPEDFPRVHEVFQRIVEKPDTVASAEYRVRHGDGGWVWFESTGHNLLHDPAVEGVVINSRDVTERKHAEEALHQSEERLRQAQRLDAVGKLAGGVAHDFNNVLTVIQGNAEMLLMDVPPDSMLCPDLQEIQDACRRASKLTHQLLAFSRRQVLQPRVLDLNATVTEMDRMLRRLIGEDVDLVLALDPYPARVEADPGQIEQVLMNLVVNARDAMPTGGRLEIETRTVCADEAEAAHDSGGAPTGVSVRLTVRDTGAGMDEATLARVFEPFFTTKPLGKGVGLGLATVYGIIKQSGGSIRAESCPGEGSAFHIYLPAVAREPEPREAPARLAVPGSAAGTILLVEDEESVRSFARRLLERSGYRVLEAHHPQVALDLLRGSRVAVDLLLTDVVMPQMSGRALASLALALHPELKVVYMSGYTDDALAHHGVLEAGIHLIEKPFRPEALLSKIQEVLS